MERNVTTKVKTNNPLNSHISTIAEENSLSITCKMDTNGLDVVENWSFKKSRPALVSIAHFLIESKFIFI